MELTGPAKLCPHPLSTKIALIGQQPHKTNPKLTKTEQNQKTKQQQIHTCITPTKCPQAKKLQRNQKSTKNG
jgi:hypothetical protein